MCEHIRVYDVMKIKEGYIARNVVDTYVVVPVGERVIDFKGIMTLTGIAPFVWARLEEGCSREDLLAKVLAEYDVSPEQAQQDLDELLARMQELGLVEP